MDPFSFMAGLGGTAASAFMQHKTNQQNKELFYENRDHQTRLLNTAHQREVEDLRKAGLNPLLSSSLSGAGATSGSAPVMSSAGAAVQPGLSDSTGKSIAAQSMRSQNELQSTQSALNRAQLQLNPEQKLLLQSQAASARSAAMASQETAKLTRLNQEGQALTNIGIAQENKVRIPKVSEAIATDKNIWQTPYGDIAPYMQGTSGKMINNIAGFIKYMRTKSYEDWRHGR